MGTVRLTGKKGRGGQLWTDGGVVNKTENQTGGEGLEREKAVMRRIRKNKD